MATKKTADSYANIAALSVSESVAGTLSTAKFNFPFSIMDKMAILISRIEYLFDTTLAQLNSSGDRVVAALLASNSVVNIDNQADPLIVDNYRAMRLDLGAAASGNIHLLPAVKDFSALPGGGILVAPAPLYGAVQSFGAGGVLSVWIKLFYTYMELSTDDYWQLVESRRIISS